MKPDNLARILAGAGVVLGGAALVWQIVLWRLGGPRVRVSAGTAVGGFDDGPITMAYVEARNIGRAPITVQGCGFELPDRQRWFFMRPLAISSPLPHRLEAHSMASWFVHWDELRQVAAQYGSKMRVYPFVTLATGAQPKGRKIEVDV